MAREPIVTDLFRFITVRNPQLLREKQKERGFTYFPMVNVPLSKGDLKQKQGQTLENIMDYLPDAERTYKSFITYQWEKMREYLHTNKNTVEELNFETYNVPRNWKSLKDFSNSDGSSNLSKFCQNTLEGILGNRMLDYNDTSAL